MKTFVLTMDKAKDRQAIISRQLNSLGIEFEFFIGVDGSAEVHPYFARCNERLALYSAGRTFANTKKACFVGHWLLWEKCVELGEPILVLEDDAVIGQSNLMSLLDECADVLERNGYLKLSGKDRHMRRTRYDVLRSLSSGELVRWRDRVCLMSAYVITPAGARRLIPPADSEFYLHTDIYLAASWLHGVEHISILPMPVSTEADFSYIEAERGQAINKLSSAYAMRKLFKAYFACRRFVRNARFRLFELKTYRQPPGSWQRTAQVR